MAEAKASTDNKPAPRQSQIDRTTKAVMSATIDLLGEIGYRRLTIERISERSNVARSTIYRHWSNVPELTIEAFDVMLGPNPPLEDLGDLRSNLIALYTRLSKILGRSIWGRALPSLIEASHQSSEFQNLLEKLVSNRRQASKDMLITAKEKGELKQEANIEWMLDAMSGMLYHRLLLTRQPMDEPGLVEWIVDCVLTQSQN